MAESATKHAGKVLEEIHNELLFTFLNRLEVLIRDDVSSEGYVAPTALNPDNMDQIIKVTNDGMGAAAKNNIPKEIRGVSRQGNVLLSLARDNYSAVATRLQQCGNYALYLKRALNVASDPNDPNQSDGMLQTGIRRVEQ